MRKTNKGETSRLFTENSTVFLKSGGCEELLSTVLFKKSATTIEKGKWMEWW